MQTSTLFEFNFPHGGDNMDMNGRGNGNQQALQDLQNYGKGLCEDEECEDVSSHPPLTQIITNGKMQKGKKSPRRFGDEGEEGSEDAAESSPRAKKPRPLYPLFGDPQQPNDTAKEAQGLQTHGHGIRMRLSSLNLDQQEDHDVDQGQLEPSIDLGALMGLSNNDTRHSPALSDQSGIYDNHEFPSAIEDPVVSYGLRKNINRQARISTWIDGDHSGNYDPTEEAKQNSSRTKQAKQAKQTSKKRRGKKKAEDRVIVPKRIVRLRFQEVGFGNVVNIMDGYQHWPDGHSIIDSEDEPAMQEPAFYRCPTPDVEPQVPILDPLDNKTDITGHPTARGCTECRMRNQYCSMITDGHYPCTDCMDDTLDCHPIMPGLTGRCQHCEHLDQPCSFENANGEPQAMCDQCLDADKLGCEPRPAREYKTNRIDLDKILHSENRKWASCTHCREDGKRCSLKKADKPPCKQCKKKGLGCHFYDATPPEKPKKAGRKKKGRDNVEEDRAPEVKPMRTRIEEIAPEVSVPSSDFFDAEDLADLDRQSSNEEEEAGAGAAADREESPEIEMEDTDGRMGVLTEIKTSFAHPILLEIVERRAATWCSFCEIPAFPFVGHFEKKVHVLKWHNGLGYTEFAAGHREDLPATTMCQTCVMERVQIIYCENHIMERVHDILTDDDFNNAVELLMDAQPRSRTKKRQMQRWCSMCFTLAQFKCCKEQPPLINEEGEEDVQIEGCGLRLCERCELRFREEFGGDCDAMVVALDKGPKQSKRQSENVPIRADVGFLMKSGLLMANLDAAMAEP